MELQVERSSRPDRREVDAAQVRYEAGQPGEQAEILRDRRRFGARRRLGGGHAGRARLPGVVLLLPGQPAAGPLDRRPGRDQRRQELPERRRQRVSPLLRHGQGGRLPRSRGQRLPSGRGVGQHHRPVRGTGRSLRPRVRRVCWRTGRSAARRSRGPSTPAARPASSSCWVRTRRSSARSAWAPSRCTPGTRCRNWSSSTAAPGASWPATWRRARSSRTRPTP